MRVPINLASQPLENLRPVRTAVAVAALTALVLGAVILNREWRSRSEFRALIEQQASLELSLKNLDTEQRELESSLSTTQAEQIRVRSGFLNSLILRKSLSWTQLFMDLEKTLPPRARITAIHPKLSATEDVDLELTVSAASMEPLVAFLKNLESSTEFGPPVVGTQHALPDKNSAGDISLDLTTRYVQDRSKNLAPQPEALPPPEAGEVAAMSEQERQ
ncbi:MAG: hypothetical protein A3H94_03785 [Acidobacteria bacterium RIFCSPLOWO2_02_FULL_60_20]|nr:MAG: hypothetical protein A3H94_03785 [Acidobacteria bacterium RIFCSPLOWO2_02_FULL_60_20]